MQVSNEFTKQTGSLFPLIMAPMFLVSNYEMICAAIDKKVVGVFPSLNFRKEKELKTIISKLFKYTVQVNSASSFGVNLIVQETNPLYKSHLKICLDSKVRFFITSLGNPAEVINQSRDYGALVYCDVTNLKHAYKAAHASCNGFIAVGSGAGGHAGKFPLHVLVPALKKEFPHIPVVAAGGISNGTSILSMLAAGASGVSVGTRFIASDESPVSAEYKSAIIKMSMDEVVLTDRISGTPLSVMYTDYVKKIGLSHNFFEAYLNKHPQTKRWFKSFVQLRGLGKLQQAVLPGSYKTIWSAGQSIQFIDSIKPCRQIIDDLINETNTAFNSLNQTIHQ